MVPQILSGTRKGSKVILLWKIILSTCGTIESYHSSYSIECNWRVYLMQLLLCGWVHSPIWSELTNHRLIQGGPIWRTRRRSLRGIGLSSAIWGIEECEKGPASSMQCMHKIFTFRTQSSKTVFTCWMKCCRCTYCRCYDHLNNIISILK